jgi:hypothetical protein
MFAFSGGLVICVVTREAVTLSMVVTVAVEN